MNERRFPHLSQNCTLHFDADAKRGNRIVRFTIAADDAADGGAPARELDARDGDTLLVVACTVFMFGGGDDLVSLSRGKLLWPTHGAPVVRVAELVKYFLKHEAVPAAELYGRHQRSTLRLVSAKK